MLKPILFVLVLLLGSCNSHEDDARAKAIEEILQTEKEFAIYAAEKGIPEAFSFYADSGAVIKRSGDTLIKGKDRIRDYYSVPYFKTATVTWSPDFADASANGDLGYTYGKYRWESKDSTGKSTTTQGLFHTVWKKQPDGKWKYVWD